MATHFEHLHAVSASQAYKATFASHAHTPSSSIKVQCPIEVSFSDDTQTQLAYFLRLLKQASQQNRWVTFIGHEALVDKNLLQSAGIDLNKVLVVCNKKGHSVQELMIQALQSGNSSAVIVTGDILDFTSGAIRDAAILSESFAFVINRQAKQQMTIH